MTGKSTLWPHASTGALREDVLRVLGVLKVATPGQIQELTRPHLTLRHPHPHQGRRTKAHRNAALDLASRGLTVSEGHSRDGHKLWGLTPAGLEAAAQVLDRPLAEMGSIARGAATHGAQHAMAVNATVHGLLQPRPEGRDLEQLGTVEQTCVEVGPEGLGSLMDMSTEVTLPVTGTWATPGRGAVQADLLVAAPEAAAPLLFVEVDRATMIPERVAQKVAGYQRFFERRDRQGELWWKARWETPEPVQPVVAFVLTGRSEENLIKRAAAILTLADQYRTPFPVIGTTLMRLTERGPHGETWWNARRGGSPAPLANVLSTA
ncbi:replication-relaxation family protein [Streptomyces sp. NPDC050145]|uniref:replication-relaxation family protein n=1 Tax=Streptomyces sp. NPDC050145 TaxID=3365602 RepID=UPI00379A8FDF